MKKVLIAFLFLSLSLYAQNSEPSESQKLTIQIAALYKEGKLNEAIPLAEKVLKLEKSQSPRNNQSYATAIFNLAHLKKERARQLLFTNDKDPSKYYLKSKDLALDAESLFKELMEVHEKVLKAESAGLAVAYGELGWIMENYLYPAGIRSNPVERLEKAESLYNKSTGLKEKALGSSHEITLASIYDLAEFYLKQIRLEKAIPLYQKHISLTEKQAGQDSKLLLGSLQRLALIQVSIDDKEAAEKTCERISKIKGETEKVPEPNLNLARRRNVNGRSGSAVIVGAPITTTVLVPGVVSPGFGGGIIGLPPGGIGGGPFFPGGRPFPAPKSVNVKVLIDEGGNVIEALPETKDEKLRKKAEKEILQRKYTPFVYENVARKMRGWVVYFYD